jgi:hypothetical protein
VVSLAMERTRAVRSTSASKVNMCLTSATAIRRQQLVRLGLPRDTGVVDGGCCCSAFRAARANRTMYSMVKSTRDTD